MIKFLVCDLPLLLNVDWIQAFLVILSVFTAICIAVAQHAPAKSLNGLTVFFSKAQLLNEAGFHRPESPIWFALGP